MVVRYKSTGDMLSEPSAAAAKSKSLFCGLDAPAKQRARAVSFKLDEDPLDYALDQHQDYSSCKLLLSSSTPAEHRDRWHSCARFLDEERADHSRRKQRRQDHYLGSVFAQERAPERVSKSPAECKSSRTKSATDFATLQQESVELAGQRDVIIVRSARVEPRVGARRASRPLGSKRPHGHRRPRQPKSSLSASSPTISGSPESPGATDGDELQSRLGELGNDTVRGGNDNNRLSEAAASSSSSKTKDVAAEGSSLRALSPATCCRAPTELAAQQSESGAASRTEPQRQVDISQSEWAAPSGVAGETRAAPNSMVDASTAAAGRAGVGNLSQGNSESDNSSQMVGFALANQLVGAYKGSAHWQHPASYSVAQTAGSEVCNNKPQGREPEARQVESRSAADASVSRACRSPRAGGSGVSGAMSSSRPGRSPVSLQRETSARLARHRLKIQQRRQEQLASLALRERSQLNSVCQPHNQLPRLTASHERRRQSVLSSSGANRTAQASNRRAATATDIEADVIDFYGYGDQSGDERDNEDRRSLLGRLFSFVRPPSSERGHRIRSRSINIIRGAHRNYRLPATSDAEFTRVDIHASSPSRRCSQQVIASPFSSRNTSARQSNSSGNVIVYRSIDMLRNSSTATTGFSHSSSSASRSHYRDRFESQALKDSDEANEMLDSDDTGTICSSASSLSLNRPFCKICHLGSSKSGDKLISPCKCSGTMRYIHCGCLLKWLEISNRTNEKPMSCELCAHEYTWHRRFNYKQMQVPKCSLKDVFLHLTFVAAIGLMLFCALAPILAKKPIESAALSQDQQPAGASTRSAKHQVEVSAAATSAQIATTFRHGTFGGYSNHLASSRLAHDEKFMIVCAALFFISFFLAIYVQTKARDTLYGLFAKFLSMNQTYYITEYDHGQQQQSDSNSGNNNSIINNASNPCVNSTKHQSVTSPRHIQQDGQQQQRRQEHHRQQEQPSEVTIEHYDHHQNHPQNVCQASTRLKSSPLNKG